MAGGLLNLISVGNANIILTGQPTKTFFKVTYSKYTNFGLQKFRLDYDGSRDLRLTTPSQFTFRIKRYADLLMDTYLCVTLPDIWSPIYNPTADNNYEWVGYDFRWIRNIGFMMIKSIEINCGSSQLQSYTGEYLAAMVERDFNSTKRDLINRMSGNVPEINDPANAYGRNNAYPSAFYTNNTVVDTSSIVQSEPSIRGRTLYIPINTWFTLNSRCAFPLISLQYNELSITVTLRPIQELFQVRDVTDTANHYPYIQPDFNQEQYRLYRFLQTPPDVRIDAQYQGIFNVYDNLVTSWNADVHMVATYCFLSNEESRVFAAEDQVYLVKDVLQYNFYDVTGTSKVKLENTTGMVSSWMWYLQRNDVNMRNEWYNYTNWPYESLPKNVQIAPRTIPLPPRYDGSLNIFNSIYTDYKSGYYDPNMVLTIGPIQNPNTTYDTGYYITGDIAADNQRDIMLSFGILFEGDYRETSFPRGVYDYIEKYTRTAGTAKDGLYCYNFCLSTSPFEYQPSGAINMSKFKNIELEFTTMLPSTSPINKETVLCGDNGLPLAVSTKPGWQLYDYTYNLTVFEERYNILSFIGGNCGMMYAR
jgi:Major capsid protein N-terminus/Large eukaryotic DNA virus major capsid protein